MIAYLRRLPQRDDDSVVAHRVQQIGDHSMTHGCVHQRRRGCNLAPVLRAESCDHFDCSGVLTLKGQFASGEPVRASLVHPRGERLSGG